MRVDLPSSTEPAVEKRNKSMREVVCYWLEVIGEMEEVPGEQ
jgi:hypothetical protein